MLLGFCVFRGDVRVGGFFGKRGFLLKGLQNDLK